MRTQLFTKLSQVFDNVVCGVFAYCSYTERSTRSVILFHHNSFNGVGKTPRGGLDRGIIFL